MAMSITLSGFLLKFQSVFVILDGPNLSQCSVFVPPIPSASSSADHDQPTQFLTAVRPSPSFLNFSSGNCSVFSWFYGPISQQQLFPSDRSPSSDFRS